MAFTACAGPWTMVYRYVTDGPRPGELQDVLRRGVHPHRGVIWITPNFFRFQNEAVQFLGLLQNRAEAGLYLDLGQPSGTLAWRVSPPVGPLPGGGLELPLAVPAPIAASQVVETFPTELAPVVNGAGHPPQWPFLFTEH